MFIPRDCPPPGTSDQAPAAASAPAMTSAPPSATARLATSSTAFVTSLAGIFLLACACCAHAAAVDACKQVILTGDPEYPPFSWHDGKAFHGSAIEIASLALERIHMPYQIRYVGRFPQVLEQAKLGKVHLIAELKNTPERQEYLAYSSVPIFTNPIAVFIRSDHKLAYQTWDDLVGRRGVMTASNKFGGGFDEFLKRRLTVDIAETIAASFANLATGQADYYVNSYYPGIFYLKQEGLEADFKALQPFVTATENFAAWSKASPCADKRSEFDAVLMAMVRSGEVRRMLDSNLEKFRRR
ncbi:transporter substrate-binding domain-containing protein [soil metagenome]